MRYSKQETAESLGEVSRIYGSGGLLQADSVTANCVRANEGRSELFPFESCLFPLELAVGKDAIVLIVLSCLVTSLGCHLWLPGYLAGWTDNSPSRSRSPAGRSPESCWFSVALDAWGRIRKRLRQKFPKKILTSQCITLCPSNKHTTI